MKVNHTDLPAILGQYVDSEIAPKATGGQKFLAYAALFAAQARMANIIQTYTPVLKAAGIMGDDGMIDADAAYDMAKFAMDKAGKVNVMGYIMDSSDVDALYDIAQSYGK